MTIIQNLSFQLIYKLQIYTKTNLSSNYKILTDYEYISKTFYPIYKITCFYYVLKPLYNIMLLTELFLYYVL